MSAPTQDWAEAALAGLMEANAMACSIRELAGTLEVRAVENYALCQAIRACATLIESVVQPPIDVASGEAGWSA